MPALPSLMRQVVFDGAGSPDVIRIAKASVPRPSSGKVLVEVVAAGINRADLMQRAGHYPPPPGESEVPGMEIAGHVAALGEGVTGLRLGDAVCALLGSGPHVFASLHTWLIAMEGLFIVYLRRAQPAFGFVPWKRCDQEALNAQLRQRGLDGRAADHLPHRTFRHAAHQRFG